SRTPPRPTPWLLAFYVSLALALLSKGTVAFVHVALALAAYHACYRTRPPRPILAHLAGVILLLALTLPWPLAVMRQVPGALALWRYESVGELAENTRNAVPWWGYLPKLPYLALPWTPLWAAAIAYVVSRVRGATPATKRRRRRLLFPLAWYVAAVVFFSFVNLKKDAYLLPVMPAQS